MIPEENQFDVSVVIPVCERHKSTISVFNGYRESLSQTGKTIEYIFVIAPDCSSVVVGLQPLTDEFGNIRVLSLNRDFGEATAIQIGTSHALGELILILPPYEQIEASSIPKLLDAIGDNDLIVANRYPRIDSTLNRVQARLFNSIIHRLTGQKFADLGCAVRLVRKSVLNELNLYGDQHRFLPIIAGENGFRIEEIDVPQAEADTHRRVYPLGTYVRRMLDLITVVFLTKFNKKPLRFFGLIGSASAALGGSGLLLVTIQKLFFDVSAGDRPLLLVSALFIVLGMQLIAIGLVGETIIFTHARELKEYKVREIVG